MADTSPDSSTRDTPNDPNDPGLPAEPGYDFPDVDLETWRQRVTEELGGRSVDTLRSRLHGGVEVAPLYTSDDLPATPAGFPGLPPFTRGTRLAGVRGRGWRIAQEVGGPAVSDAAEAVRTDLARGVDLLWLRFDDAFRSGLDPASEGAAEQVGRGGVAVATASELGRLLDGVGADPEMAPPTVSVVLDAGGAGLAAASLLVAWAEARGVALRDLRGSFGCDPLGALARDGSLPTSADRALDQLAALASWSVEHAPGVRAALVSTRPYHDAGASAPQELAFGLATGVSYLRRMVASGLTVEAAASQLLFSFSVGGDLFQEIAKLRAARLLWAKAVAAAGGGAGARAMRLHARTSAVEATVRDPWTNLLRGCAGTFAAVVGGAHAVTTAPFDEPLGPPASASRRHAAGIQHVLGEEAHLARVADPGGGSWYLEALTDRLARDAWELFRAVERRGGVADALADGWIAGELAAVAEERGRAVATRREPIVGVSVFPRLDERTPERSAADLDAARAEAEGAVSSRDAAPGDALANLADADPERLVDGAVEAARRGATGAEITAALAGSEAAARSEPLPVRRRSAPFEALRAASDRHLERTGERPRIFLANLGPLAEHGPRKDFAVDLFAAGGVEAVGGGGDGGGDDGGFDDPAAAADAFDRSGAGAAVICGTDERYAELAAGVAAALADRGARRIYLAGRPGEREEELRRAGVDAFVHLGVDAVATLESHLDAMEVAR